MNGELEITKIAVVSVLRLFALIVPTVAAIVSIVTFIIRPTKAAKGLNLKSRLLSMGIFIILYTALILFAILALTVLYNFFAELFGGVRLIIK